MKTLKQSLDLIGSGELTVTVTTARALRADRASNTQEAILKAAERLGVAPRLCLALEDSYNGVRSAFAAGMMTIMVPDLHWPTTEIAALANYVVPTTTRAAQVVLAVFDAAAAAK